MSASSGIIVSDELSQQFASAIQSQDIRFIKVVIRNESMVSDGVTALAGDFESDLELLQNLLEDSEPAYVLSKLDTSNQSWLAISYVPDDAKVRAKMLYASSRFALTKALGSSYFIDSLFATSKADLTVASYKAHVAHNAAPQPLSSREKNIEEARVAERAATGTPDATSSRTRRNHVGSGVEFGWEDKLISIVPSLASQESDRLLILSVDTVNEVLQLHTDEEISANQIGSKIPVSDPSYALFLWCRGTGGQIKRDLAFIYSCPSASPVKSRMVYSSGVLSTMQTIQKVLEGSGISAKRVESSEPLEINEAFLANTFGLDDTTQTAASVVGERPAFARPKGPTRKK